MKRRLPLLIFAVLAASCEPNAHGHCDDTLVGRVPSPDGALEIQIYNRSCARGTGLSTYSVVHDPKAPASWPRRIDVCYLASFSGGYHPMEAVWRDRTQIEISSPEELIEGYTSREDKCGDIAVSYKLKLRGPR